ncbi:orotidine-5'-phosphate decarboxylase [Rudaeicoccus suwonensis]|uniref:Orotidine 5'-phosphate decarboxylase n=1 Tax=Rudaeicoccus suwonensis TaxID=657409 RepID=A0A561EA94_9MICO|nr:orotidine-5'-phosphate decarboxylase [Rudaeicoccus suwonensis]TWE12530.1 orotidine-5'-phosphate decarboxylase [Rudaeicoccus suwonensis]
MSPFGIRLGAAMSHQGPVCVGIDPHRALLEAWGLPDTVEGLRRFSLTALEAFAGHAAAVKPQSAFFERFGSAGVAVLEEVLAGLREAGTVSLLDVKRGDIGSTMGAYAEAYLSDGSPLRADAVTVSPYLGFGSLDPALELARSTGRGVFVLAMTSNPEGAGVQHATWHDTTVAGEVIARTTRANAAAVDAGVLGDVGLVVGATVGGDIAELGLADDLAASAAPLLAPGFGAQGATVADVTRGFGAAAGQVLLATSRAVLQQGPDIRSLRVALRQAQDEAAALRG